VTFDEESIRKENGQAQVQDPDPLAIIHEHKFEIKMQEIELGFPTKFEEAMNSSEAEQWREAALKEIEAHKDNETWTLINLPKGAKAIRGRWIFTKKTNTNGTQTHKARFVAKGYSQVYGLDYHETYSAVLVQASLRLLICIAVNKDWKFYKRDFKTAYLNAPLLTPIYVQQPDNFVEHGKENMVCPLNKPLYGLKQARRAW
jgi:hypothetical protein